MNRVCLEQGSGWVNYQWPKPSMKVSFVKMAEFSGEKFVVYSGVYDITLDEIKGALNK